MFLLHLISSAEQKKKKKKTILEEKIHEGHKFLTNLNIKQNKNDKTTSQSTTKFFAFFFVV